MLPCTITCPFEAALISALVSLLTGKGEAGSHGVVETRVAEEAVDERRVFERLERRTLVEVEELEELEEH